MNGKYFCLFALFFLTSCVSILYVEKALPEKGLIKITEAENKNQTMTCYLRLLGNDRIKVISAGPLFLPLMPTPWLWIGYRQYKVNFQTMDNNPSTGIEFSCDKNLYCSGAQITVDGKTISTEDRLIQRQSNKCELTINTEIFLNSKVTIRGVKIEKNGVEYPLDDVSFESSKKLKFESESIFNVVFRYYFAHSN